MWHAFHFNSIPDEMSDVNGTGKILLSRWPWNIDRNSRHRYSRQWTESDTELSESRQLCIDNNLKFVLTILLYTYIYISFLIEWRCKDSLHWNLYSLMKPSTYWVLPDRSLAERQGSKWYILMIYLYHILTTLHFVKQYLLLHRNKQKFNIDEGSQFLY